jgi:hypothetical protein
MVQELSGVQLRVSWYIFLQYLSEQQQVSKTVPNNLPLLSVLVFSKVKVPANLSWFTNAGLLKHWENLQWCSWAGFVFLHYTKP